MSGDAQAPAPEDPGELRPDSKSIEKAVPKKRTQNRKDVSAVEPVAQPLASPISSVASNLKDPPATKKEAREWSNTVIALIAVVVAIASILYTAFQDRTNREDQRVQRATSQAVATVQQATAQAAATSDAALDQEVVSLKKTQTALEADQSRLVRMQVFPFMHTVESEPAVLTLTNASVITDTRGTELVRAVGRFETTLANDGGRNAWLTAVEWVGGRPGGKIRNLRVDSVEERDSGLLELPSAIESQSARRVELEMVSDITASRDTINKTSYQLGRVISDTLQAEGTSVIFRFYQEEPLTATVKAISLAIPPQAIRTDPPSPFSVTEADQTGVVRLRLTSNGSVAEQEAWILIAEPGSTTTARLRVGLDTRLTLPVRDGPYPLRVEFGQSPTVTTEDMSVQVLPGKEIQVQLRYPKSRAVSRSPLMLMGSIALGVLLAGFVSGGSVMVLSRRNILLEWRFEDVDRWPRAGRCTLLFSAIRKTRIVSISASDKLILHRERTGYALALQNLNEEKTIGFVSDEVLSVGSEGVWLKEPSLRVTMMQVGR